MYSIWPKCNVEQHSLLNRHWLSGSIGTPFLINLAWSMLSHWLITFHSSTTPLQTRFRMSHNMFGRHRFEYSSLAMAFDERDQKNLSKHEKSSTETPKMRTSEKCRLILDRGTEEMIMTKCCKTSVVKLLLTCDIAGDTSKAYWTNADKTSVLTDTCASIQTQFRLALILTWESVKDRERERKGEREGEVRRKWSR